LIGKKFGLRWREVDFLTCEFYVLYHRDENHLPTDQGRHGRALCSEVVLDDESGARLIAFASGFGDGSYAVEAWSRSGDCWLWN
jgi:hypothetical protein